MERSTPLRLRTPTLRFALLLALVASCSRKDKTENVAPPDVPPRESVATTTAAGPEIDEALLPAFGPLPASMDSSDNPPTEEKIALGRALYYETRLSVGKDVSCNSCHDLRAYGVDGEKTSPGHKQQRGARNSPTVYNAAGQFVQFWDGRAKNVEEQAKGPILNPVEMAMPDEKTVLKALKAASYEASFKKAFPGEKDPVSMNNVAKAIGAFERKLVTPSRWDRFLAGDKTAITAAEKAGFKTFTDTGCNTCHAGPYVGGQMFQKLGLARPWPKQDDLGRYAVTHDEADRMVFKVPSLRNVRKTAPYFHDGSMATLEEAIKLMALHQLGKPLDDAKVASIAAFLDALTGELPTAFIARPSGP